MGQAGFDSHNSIITNAPTSRQRCALTIKKRFPKIRSVKHLRWKDDIDAKREADAAFNGLLSKRRKKPRQRPKLKPTDEASPMKPGYQAFLEWIATPCWEAARHGVLIDYRVIHNRNRRSTLHVMFKDEAGRVLLHWYPGNGNAIADGVRHFAASPDMALQIANSVKLRAST